MCAIIYPDQFKQATDQKQKSQAGVATPPAAPPAAAPKVKPDGWQAQTSPSQVYRANPN